MNPGNFSPYPREQQGSWFPFPPGVSFDAFSEAFNRMKENTGVFLGAGAVAVILPTVINQAVSLVNNMIFFGSVAGSADPTNTTAIFTSTAVGLLLSFAISGLQFGCYNGLTLMGIDAIQRRPVQFRVFDGFQNFGSLMVTSFLLSLITTVGLLLCIVPGIYLYGLLCMAPMYASAEKLGPIEALQKSAETMKPFAFPAGGYLIVMGLLAGIGVCACFVGLLYTVPVAMIAFAYLFLANNPSWQNNAVVQNPIDGGPQPPTTGGWTPPSAG